MKKLTIMLACGLLVSIMGVQLVSAQEVRPTGINPDSPFYGFDLMFERIQLSFANNEQAKLNLQLKFAGERIDEIEQMIRNQNEEGLKRAIQERARIRVEIEKSIGLEENLEMKENIQTQLETQTQRMEKIEDSDSLEIKNTLSLEIKNNNELGKKIEVLN